MPIVPIYEASVQQQPDSPVRVTDSEVARAQGESIKDLGKGVFDVSQMMLEQEKIRKKTKNQIELANWTNYSQNAADTAENNAYLNAKEDGSDLSDLFEKEYDKTISDGLKDKNIDAELYAILQNQAGEIRNKTRGDLLKAQREAFVKYADRSFADIKNQGGARILKNPLMYDEVFNKYSELITNSALTPTMKQKAIMEARKDYADSALRSYMDNERWDEAKSALNDKFTTNYTPEQRDKMMEEIESTRLKVADRRQKENDRAEKTRKEYLEVVNTKFFRTRLDEINDVLNVDATQDDSKMAAVNDSIQKIRGDVAAGDLKEAQGNYLIDLLTKDRKTEMGYNAVPYWDRITQGKDLDKIAQDVRDNIRDLDPEVAGQLFKAIEVEKNRQKKKTGSKGSNTILKSAFNSIKEQVPKDPSGGFRSVEDGTTYRAAELDFWKQYYGSDKWKNDPGGLADQIIEKYYWSTSKGSRINRLQNFDDPKKAASESNRLFRQGKMDKDEYLETLRALKDRANKEKNLKNRKNGVK